MWWSSARSQERWTATWLRCGEAQVRETYSDIIHVIFIYINKTFGEKREISEWGLYPCSESSFIKVCDVCLNNKVRKPKCSRELLCKLEKPPSVQISQGSHAGIFLGAVYCVLMLDQRLRLCCGPLPWLHIFEHVQCLWAFQLECLKAPAPLRRELIVPLL